MYAVLCCRQLSGPEAQDGNESSVIVMRKVRILQSLPDVHPAQDGSKVYVLSLQDSDRIVLMMFYMDYQVSVCGWVFSQKCFR